MGCVAPGRPSCTGGRTRVIQGRDAAEGAVVSPRRGWRGGQGPGSEVSADGTVSHWPTGWWGSCHSPLGHRCPMTSLLSLRPPTPGAGNQSKTSKKPWCLSRVASMHPVGPRRACRKLRERRANTRRGKGAHGCENSVDPLIWVFF